MDKTKILVLLPTIPYPLDAGGSIGVFNMLKAISREFEVHLWFMLREGKVYLDRLNEFDRAINYICKIHYSIKKKGRNYPTALTIHEKFDRFFLKKDMQYLHNEYLKVGDSGIVLHSAQFLLDIAKIIQENNIKIVQMEFFDTKDFVYAIPNGVKKVFVHHELRFLRVQRMVDNYHEANIYDTYLVNKSKADEAAAMNAMDCVITLSDIDKQILRQIGVNSRIETSPLFIPMTNDNYPPFSPTESELAFLASGAHICNVEGLEWFISQVHPLLVKKCPSYQLTVVGSKWQNFIQSHTIPTNIKFAGFVENLSDVLPGKIMVVPILSGSGMRMKILESVNNSVPFVSTYVGAEGMGFESGRNCFIADTPSDFCNDIIALLESKTLQSDLVIKAREHYEHRFSESVLGNKRIGILKSLV